MLHEFHHQWCCNVAAPSGYGLDEDGLVDGSQHWKSTLLVPPKPVYPILGGPAGTGGWIENPDGTFTPGCGRSEPPYSFTKLGLYVMGLVSADEVPPVEVLVPLAVPPDRCAPIRAKKISIPVAAVVAANGYSARLPIPGRDVETPTPRPGLHSRWYAQGSSLALAPGEKRWAWVAIQNTGSTAWKRGTPSELHLGINGDDRSVFDAGLAFNWPLPDRVAFQGEPYVRPGQVAVFGFQLQGVGPPRTYRLDLRPVIDGVTWLEDDGVFMDIEVTQPHHSRWVAQSPYPSITVGETTTLWVKFQNTGTSTWMKGSVTEARLGVNLDDRTISNLGMAVGWPFAERPAIQAEPIVAPRAIGTFTFQVRGVRAGTYTLHLRPVIDGVTWMEDEGVFVYITVR
jgi:hypothetical protein